MSLKTNTDTSSWVALRTALNTYYIIATCSSTYSPAEMWTSGSDGLFFDNIVLVDFATHSDLHHALQHSEFLVFRKIFQMDVIQKHFLF